MRAKHTRGGTKMVKKNKKKTNNASQIIMLLLFMFIGAICGILMVRYSFSSMKEDFSGMELLYLYIQLIIYMYLAICLQIVMHEFGHFVFGLLTGYRFTSFRIGSFMWMKQDGKIHFFIMSVAGTGGQCLMAPPDMVNRKMPYALYNLGGSIMNMLTALLFTAFYFLCREIPYISIFFLIISIIGVTFALINGIPMQMGVVNNDGYNAMSLGKSMAAIHSFWVQMKTNEMLAKGVRVKDMPEEWFSMPEDTDLMNGITATMAVFYANRLMDSHCFAEVSALIDTLISKETAIVGFYKEMLVCDRIYCALISGSDTEITEIIEKLYTKAHKQFIKQMHNNLSVIRTKYALALLYEKDRHKAELMQKQFEKYAKKYPYVCDIESERELMEIARGLDL